jgi:hypothetical protein
MYFEEMKKEWLKALRRLWFAFDKPIQNEQFEVYASELQNIPLGLLESGIKAIINKSKYFPRLSELKSEISQEMKKDITDGSLDQENIDEWIRFQDEKWLHKVKWNRVEANA